MINVLYCKSIALNRQVKGSIMPDGIGLLYFLCLSQ